jgi:hypothetical protein
MPIANHYPPVHYDEGQLERSLTVLQLRRVDNGTDVIFAESARFYHLLPTNPRYDQILRSLSAGVGQPFKVRFTAPNSDVIEAVSPVPDCGA